MSSTLLDQPLGNLACEIAGATRVFHAFNLDFCCGGHKSLREAAALRGIEPEEVNTQALGLGGLGTILTLTLRDIAAQMVEGGTEMSGPNLYDFLKTTDGLYLYGGITPLKCGAAAPTYSSFCSFVFEATEYKDGAVVSVENGKLWDSIPLLP